MNEERTQKYTSHPNEVPRRIPLGYPPQTSPYSKTRIDERIRTFIDAMGGADALAQLAGWPLEKAHEFYCAPVENHRILKSLVERFGWDDVYFVTGESRTTVEAIYAECARRDSVIRKHNVSFDHWLMLNMLHAEGINTREELLRRLLHLPRFTDRRRQHDLATLLAEITA
jgi:hypothetical protein